MSFPPSSPVRWREVVEGGVTELATFCRGVNIVSFLVITLARIPLYA